MHVRFVVFRAAGVEMTPGELRQAVLTEINEQGEWQPPLETST